MKNIITALVLAALPSSAVAHVSFAEDEATSGESFRATLVVPHGCDGRATRQVRLTLPKGFVDAKPMPKPGWTVEVVEGDAAGGGVSSGPAEIRWSGGDLPDAFADEFVVRGRFDASLAGSSAAFPVTQLCADGSSIAWDEIAAEGEDPHSPAHPAPVVAVRAAEGAGHHGGVTPSAETIALSGGFARAMLSNAKVGGGYLEIRNEGAEPDRLLSATSPLAGEIQFHTMEMEGDVMRMRALDEGIEVPAGGVVAFAPGGRHLMFLDVSEPFRQGGTVPVTLRFERAGTIETVLTVGAPNAAAAEGGAHAH